jgi:hypothetical protein
VVRRGGGGWRHGCPQLCRLQRHGGPPPTLWSCTHHMLTCRYVKCAGQDPKKLPQRRQWVAHCRRTPAVPVVCMALRVSRAVVGPQALLVTSSEAALLPPACCASPWSRARGTATRPAAWAVWMPRAPCWHPLLLGLRVLVHRPHRRVGRGGSQV